MNVEGHVAEGYETVRQVFRRMVDDGRETGAGLSVWRDGEEVVRLSGGWADTARQRPWRADTLVQPYSVSKPFAALAALVAVRDGALTLDEPIGRYWPGYAVAGKERTTLRHVLTHQAGQARFPVAAAGTDLLDGARLREILAESAPEYVPGTSLGEHALTYGHLIDGVLRAGAGVTLERMFADVVRPALGLDGWFGVPDGELHRVADLEPAAPGWAQQLPQEPWLTIPAGLLDMERMNSTAWRQSVFGAANLHATATSVAEFFAGLTRMDGPVHRLLGSELHAAYLAPQVRRHDEVFATTVGWTLGLIRDDGKIAKGGLGGSAAWWSVRHGHSCAFLTRRLDDLSRAAEIAAALGDDLSLG
ncbi:EstA family serine hydrolase [Streptomyces camponoticapitis]|uniref:EstA family serine hydrolase n=1 Tax=Streptomyces camponoticapitis TaxID=1616125 RepID=A0ABQ2E082_9ACTN|nr:serine hydrolase domain-containing protein [Streptomyces camponoticapitis]GGJ84020.1 EstA family serine hydrolase [Streptomyces camponoticapitis]